MIYTLCEKAMPVTLRSPASSDIRYYTHSMMAAVACSADADLRCCCADQRQR